LFSPSAGAPALSVLLPAFNAAGTLAASLASIQRQTETDWQCVIVDDGSSDRTLECARRFAAADSRFEVLSGPHRGLVGALGAGLERCRGALVARMDADDLMHRERLRVQRALLDAEPGFAAVGCHVRIFPRRHLGDGRRAYESWLNGVDSPERVRAEAFVECPIAHPTLMIRRSVLSSFGYRDRGWPEDYDLVLRLLAAGHAIGVAPRRLHLWRDGPGRLSRSSSAYSIERFTACKAEFLARGFLRQSDRYVLWGYGGTGRALRRALAAHGKHPSHIVELHPGRLGRSIHGAPVIPPDALASLRRLPIVASVASRAPRSEIRDYLVALGRRELGDFVCAA
jgi:glycosyltransferase involved in cell wall biosynthesis